MTRETIEHAPCDIKAGRGKNSHTPVAAQTDDIVTRL